MSRRAVVATGDGAELVGLRSRPRAHDGYEDLRSRRLIAKRLMRPARTASAMLLACTANTSTQRNSQTISSGVSLFLVILPSFPPVKRHTFRWRNSNGADHTEVRTCRRRYIDFTMTADCTHRSTERAPIRLALFYLCRLGRQHNQDRKPLTKSQPAVETKRATSTGLVLGVFRTSKSLCWVGALGYSN